MFQGLKNILSSITLKPESNRLIDRYISLLQDLTIDQRKGSLLDLSRILINGNTHRALIIAQEILQAEPDNLEALNIIKTSLITIGKDSKAKIIQDKIKKIKSNQSIFKNNFIGLEISHNSTSDTNIYDDFSEESSTQKQYIKTQIVSPPSIANETKTKKTYIKKKKEQPKFETINQIKNNKEKVTPLTNRIIFALNCKLFSQGKSWEEIEEIVLTHKNNTRVVNIAEQVLRFSRNFHEQLLYDQTANTKQGIIKGQNKLGTEAFEKLKQIFIDHQTDEIFIWNFFQSIWGNASNEDTLHLLRELKLTRKNVGYWGLYIDSLLATGNARKALYEIFQTLELKPKLNWALTAWDRLPFIWDRLKLRGIRWSKEDGLVPLMSALAKRRPQKYIGLIIEKPFKEQFPQKKSA